MRNLITDVAGLRVGHAVDEKLASGVTALVFDEPAVAAIDIRGGGTGTRETDLLEPVMTVDRVDAIALSGGSAFGLEAPAGVQAWLAAQGRGFAVGAARVPIVPGAILFDLLNGGDKTWDRYPPYRELGYAAAERASLDFALGNAGAGFGATVVNLKGGLGSASAQVDGFTIGAIAAVNACGSVTIGDGPHFWSAAFEQGDEFGGRGLPPRVPPEALVPALKGGPRQNTTLVAVATDAVLTKSQAKRLAVLAQTGFARAIYPVHTPLDGDVVFAVATGRKALPDPVYGLSALGAVAANTVARAIARGVYEAKALPFADALPSWKDRFGKPKTAQ
ncbi:MAG: P1 family peptidase [Pseudorhodoplanes sp.]